MYFLDSTKSVEIKEEQVEVMDDDNDDVIVGIADEEIDINLKSEICDINHPDIKEEDDSSAAVENDQKEEDSAPGHDDPLHFDNYIVPESFQYVAEPYVLFY